MNLGRANPTKIKQIVEIIHIVKNGVYSVKYFTNEVR